MMITKKAVVLAVLAKSADAFSTTSMTTPKSSSNPLASRKAVSALSLSSPSGGEDDAVKITSVNAKEIYFDEKAGRFFETKLVSEDDETSTDADVSGPFKKANPLAKPEGTFFEELFGKGGDDNNIAAASAPGPPSPPAVASTPPPAKQEEKAPMFGGFFQNQEAQAVAKPTPPSPPSTPVSTPPPAKQEESAPLFGGFFQKQEEPAPPKPVAPAPVETRAVAPVKTEEPASPFSFLDGLFKPSEPAAVPEPEPVIKYDPVTISPDFRVAAAFLGAGLLLDQIPYIQLTLGPIVTLLGILFVVQSFRVRFVFTENNELQLETVTNILTGETESPGENVVVGGANRWACDTIVNYDFFPAMDSSPVGPILVYFKETQTPKESWNEGPGMIANSGDDKPKGQVHFFPAVCNAEQIQEEFVKRGCGKV